MGNNQNSEYCGNCPIEQVSWNDVQEFIKRLNNMTGKKFRLPTEAEWEYAAKVGEKSRGFLYSGSNNLSRISYNGIAKGTFRSSPVGRYQPNELGLYDMTGNVWEWCSD